MSLSAGLKQNYAREVDSGSWQDDFAIAKSSAELLALVHGVTTRNVDGVSSPVTQLTILYTGTDALTLTNFAGFPIGTIIIAAKLYTLYLHQAQSASPVVGDWYKQQFTQCT